MKRFLILSLAVSLVALAGCSQDSPLDPAGSTDKADKSHGGGPRGRDGDGGVPWGMATYEVTIENLSPATGAGASQPFSPPVLASHSRAMHIFKKGRRASEEIELVAEDAINGPLVEMLEGSRRVHQVVEGDGVILPGASAQYEIQSSLRANRLSAVFMLVNTNDGFSGLEGVRLPLWGERTFEVRSYDAGTEENTELADHIPGPCCGSPGMGVDTHGRIRRHQGIMGGADLDPAVYGWDEPVARITVRRIMPTYEITIANLTPATVAGGSQVFSPPILVAHRGRIGEFSLRGLASSELATIAEDGDTGPMKMAVEGSHNVFAMALGSGPIVPGAEDSYLLEAGLGGGRLSLAFMLVNTNDGFGAVSALRLPAGGSRIYDLIAWDAGSEMNTELASDIPGPCCGSPGVGPDESVPIAPHAGIQGVGDLDPADYGWSEPAATLTVTRVK